MGACALFGCGGKGDREVEAGNTPVMPVGSGSDAALDANESDASTPPGSSGVVSGAASFPVRWMWMNPAVPARQCAIVTTADGGIAATAIYLLQVDLSAEACADASFVPSAAGQRFIAIQMAAPAYATRRSVSEALSAGAYTIGNESVPDEDLCMLPTGATAILQVLELPDAAGAGALPIWNAVVGTVTVTGLSATSIAGAFDVVLGDPNGGSADGGALSGSFDASLLSLSTETRSAGGSRGDTKGRPGIPSLSPGRTVLTRPRMFIRTVKLCLRAAGTGLGSNWRSIRFGPALTGNGQDRGPRDVPEGDAS